MRVQKVRPLVYEVLVNNPVARGDDFILINEVLKNFVNEQMPLETVLTHHVELGVPSFASIIRIRRKIQEQHPELLPSDAVIEMREAEEQAYKEWVKSE